VFWVRGGQWLLFPVEVQGERVILHPPPEFREVYERLAGEDPPRDADDPLSN
jgi:hypothetical protein